DELTWKGATGFAFGRLRLGQSIASSSAEVASLAPVMREAFEHTPDWARGASSMGLQEYLVGNVSRMLWFLFGSVVCLLLIASGNVANLLLVRAAERRPELALRRSLGAPTSRIARLLLGESLVLGAGGGVIGVAIAMFCVRYLPSLLPRDLPRLGEVSLNGRVLAFAALATLGPALAFGLAPVLQTWKSGLGSALRQSRTGARSSERVRGMLVSLQVALSLVLLVGAAIMGRSLTSLLNVDRGLRSDHLLTATVQPTGMDSSEEVRAFWRETLSRIEAIPGVTSAATILHLPTSGRSWNANIGVEGRPLASGDVPSRAAWQAVSSTYFATAGIPVLQGRPFAATDLAQAARVVAVNSAFVQRIFPNESPIGRRIVAGNATNNEPATIIAVVGGVRHDSLSAPPAPEIYVPIEQTVVYATALVVRTSTDPVGLASAVRSRIYSVSRNTPVTNMRSMDEVFMASLERPRLILSVLALFAGMGLVLGAVGIYGIVAYGVQQRVRELGIRAALGADAGSLRGLVLWGGVRFALLGAVVGVPVALALSRLIRGLVFGVAPTDLLSFSVAPMVLVLVAAVASWLPARRAARSDPMRALREE
ncbi:MAG: FtsX-like permease family protein, partial [Gemmatimonadaceae bacterium]